MLLAAARDLMIVFLGIELMSISVYALAGINRRSERSAEGALKYFLLGAFSTAFLLYGIALVYGATGSTNLTRIAERIALFDLAGSPLLLIGIALMLIGFGFKVATVPFHMWAPDVYEGAPSPVVGFMSTAPKAAVFAVLLRILFELNAPGRLGLIWVTAALSMTLGNLSALVQHNVKRLLAYSSIAHAGYLMMAYAALPENGIPAVMFYTAAYAAMNVGAFAVVSHLAGAGERYVTIEDYAGLGRRSPLLAAALTIFLLSLIGIPMTGGFYAKF
jgi:NADH-quinone oxidoreductase subunit N